LGCNAGQGFADEAAAIACCDADRKLDTRHRAHATMGEARFAQAGDGIGSVDIDGVISSGHRHALRAIVEISIPGL
jgi:hypothetical protein